MFGFIRVYDNEKIPGNTKVCGQVYDYMEVFGKAFIFQYLKIYDNAKVSYNSKISSFVCVDSHGQVDDYVRIFGSVKGLRKSLWGLTKKSRQRR
ncbi:hypothetical protein [Bartonella senegalensis]|uniref:hypothetical protein n=1 Tax=Bartonella senegalensis TaxID=1468418 RepID=UPI0002DA3759|nr:hypothetical protein [Bartonella senegalensis]